MGGQGIMVKSSQKYSPLAGWSIKCSGGGGVTSTHNKRGCAILTKKVTPKNPGTYLKLRPKNLELT